MMLATNAAGALGNRLLAALSPAAFDALRHHLVPVSLMPREILLKSGAAIEDVYFPLDGMVSIVQPLEDGAAIEVGVVGTEGMVGIPAILGAGPMSGHAIVQLAGTAFRLPAHLLRKEIDGNADVRALFNRYVQAVLAQVAQSAACNGRHNLQDRLARWLLTAHDCASGDDLMLSHESLAMMLGMRRAGVTVVMGMLRNAGFISNSHGRIIITNRAGLEAAACECYRVIVGEYRRLGL